MEILLTLLFIFIGAMVFGQSEPTPPAKDKRPVKVSLLSNYYEQDGDHSAVNGGIGSQELYSNTQEATIYIPVKDSSALNLSGGVDYFTSASLLTIDKYKTAASSGTSGVSGDETRVYANIGADIANKKARTLMSPSIGFSHEYDVLSMNAGYAFSKNLLKHNGNYLLGLHLIADRWMMVYPGEFRTQVETPGYTTGASTVSGSGSGTGSGTGSSATTGASTVTGQGSGSGSGSGSGNNSDGSGLTSGSGLNSGNNSGAASGGSGTTGGTTADYPVPYATPIPVTGKTITKNGKTYPVDWRYSLEATNVYSFAINRRMSVSTGLDLVSQWGMLSTPFHRVYFNDGVTDDLYKEVRIEHLPRLRLKAAAYARYNFTINPYLTLRTYLRLYSDTWDIKAVTTTVELPIRITQWFSVAPFYRFHLQQQSKYFEGYSDHVYTPGSYYTSDYDLSGFTANKVGVALRVAPLKPIAGIHSAAKNKYVFAFSSFGIRYGFYKRSDGLASGSVTGEVNFEF